MDSTRAELARANSALQSKEMVWRFLPTSAGGLLMFTTVLCLFLSLNLQSGTHLSNTLAGLQAEKEVLLRSAREQQAELASLRQQAQLHHSSVEQERHRSSMELGSLQAQLQQQVAAPGHTSGSTVPGGGRSLLVFVGCLMSLCVCVPPGSPRSRTGTEAAGRAVQSVAVCRGGG